MSFQPVLPMGGLVGWQFLQRTLDSQQESFARAPAQKRDIEYFRDRITTVTTPAELVDDRRLLRVALGAFGLQDDLNNRYFIRKMLEEGTDDPKALANRIADKRYAVFVGAFEQIFSRAPAQPRDDLDYFRTHIVKVTTPEELVDDPRLLRVALSAYGLQDDLDNRTFVRSLLEQGTTNPRALANRLDNPRYAAFVDAFDFGTDAAKPFDDPDFADLIVNSFVDPGFIDTVVTQFQRQEFEVALGNQDESMRLAMALERELPQLLERVGSEDARWLTVLGTPPLRKAFESALGFPRSIGALDLDQQLKFFRQRALSVFGDRALGQFDDPDKLKALTRRFVLMAQVQETREQSSSASTALFLLQSARRPRL